MMAAASASIFTSSPQSLPANRKLESHSSASSILVNRLRASSLQRSSPEIKFSKVNFRVNASVVAAPTSPVEEITELKLFYNPAATELEPNEEFGIAFNGKIGAKLMDQFIQSRFASPSMVAFQVPKNLRNKPIEFFNEELSKEGACERAIFPDTNMVITGCAMIGNLSLEGCNLDLVSGCMDPSSSVYNPLANVDDGYIWDNPIIGNVGRFRKKKII